MPMEVFSPDGTAIFLNKAALNHNGIKDASLLIGKYNILHDPACDAIFGHEVFERAFRGEVIAWPEAYVPIQSLVDRGVIDEKPHEAAIMDIYLLPLWDGERLAYVICVFNLKQVYQGFPEIARAKEYIDNHWVEKFDAHAVAGAVNLSDSSLYHLFKQQTGITPKEYYNKAKIAHIKEKLRDKSLTVDEAFSRCGSDSRGRFAKTFKKMTGMTPMDYRNSLK